MYNAFTPVLSLAFTKFIFSQAPPPPPPCPPTQEKAKQNSLTHFQPIFHFYTTWKHRFSDIFRGYRSGTLVENGLIQTQRKTPLNRLIGLLLRALPYFTGRYSHKQSNLERKLFEFKCIYFRGNKPLDFVQWCEQIHLADIKGCCKLGWKIIFNFNSLERKSQ